MATMTERLRSVATALVVAAVAAGCGGPAPSPSAEPATGGATRSPASSALATPALDLATGTWWRIGWVAGNQMPDHDHLRVGTLDGTVTGVFPFTDFQGDGMGAAFVRGPAAGRILVATRAGAATSLSIIDAATGEGRQVVKEAAQVLDATIDPAGEVVYWLVTDDGVRSGVWRIRVDGGAPEQVAQLAPSLAQRPAGIALAALIQPAAWIETSADGGRVVALACGRSSCELTIIDRADGSVETSPLPRVLGSLTGFAQGGVLIGSECFTLPERVFRDEAACGQADPRAVQAELQRNVRGGAELADGWHLDVIMLPNQAPMSFLMRAYAVPDAGGDAVQLPAMGDFSGNG